MQWSHYFIKSIQAWPARSLHKYFIWHQTRKYVNGQFVNNEKYFDESREKEVELIIRQTYYYYFVHHMKHEIWDIQEDNEVYYFQNDKYTFSAMNKISQSTASFMICTSRFLFLSTIKLLMDSENNRTRSCVTHSPSTIL